MRIIISEKQYDELKSNQLIYEQGISNLEDYYGSEDYIDRSLAQRAEAKANAYPNYCTYPDMAVRPKEKKVLGVSIDVKGADGEDLLIDGYCLYSCPSENLEYDTDGIFLPYTAQTEIKFCNENTGSDILKGVYNWWKNKDSFSGDNRNQSSTKWEMINELFTENKLSDINEDFNNRFKPGMVRSFTIDGVEYIGTWAYTKDGFRVMFRGFYPKGLEKRGPENKYKSPEWIDKRDDFQIVMDQYGGKLAMAAMLIGVLSGFMVTGPIALMVEIGIELAITLPLAIRDFQKGEGTSGVLNILGIGLSFLRFSKTFKGYDQKTLDSLTTKLMSREYRLLNATTDRIPTNFFRNLSKEERILLINLISDDDYGLFQTLKNLQNPEIFKKIVVPQLQKSLRESPDLYKLKPSFWKSITGKELKYAGGFMMFDMIYSEVFGYVFDSEQKEKLTGLELVIPDRIKPEVYAQMFQLNQEEVKQFCDNGGAEVMTDAISKSKNNEQAAIAFMSDLIEHGHYTSKFESKTVEVYSDSTMIKKLLPLGYKNIIDCPVGSKFKANVYIESTQEVYVLLSDSTETNNKLPDVNKEVKSESFYKEVDKIKKINRKFI